jgi:hypothetical protein
VTAAVPPRPAGGPLAALVVPRLAASLLAVASVAWVAVPLRGSGWLVVALLIAIVCAVMGSVRLAVLEVPEPDGTFYLGLAERTWHAFVRLARLPSWEEIGCAAVVWLEVLHPAHPWHTAVLGVLLIAWLLAVHVAESGVPAISLLRRQGRVLAAGLVLLGLAAGAAALPGASSGGGATALHILAAIAAVAAAIMVMPG